MALYLVPNFLAGDAEMRFTHNLPESGAGSGRGSLETFTEAVNWLLSTYAEPHALGVAQDRFSWATLADNEGVEAFATRLRTLAELCGNIHSEGTMKQQLIQGLAEYLRTEAFVFNTAQRSYQQLGTYVAGKYRAAKDVMALAGRTTPGTSSRRGLTATGPRGSAGNLLLTPSDEVIEDGGVVAALPSGSPGGYPGTPSPYARRDTPPGPPLCYMCWTRGHRVPDCKILTEKQREVVKAVRSNFLRQKDRAGHPGTSYDRMATVALVWDDLFGAEDGGNATGGGEATPPPVAPALKGRHKSGKV